MNVIAVYPGRFHPFHKGHAASFKQLAEKFGLKNTYLAISSKQEQPKSPFSAQDRAKMATSLGIPTNNIIAVSNPYSANEYIAKVEADGGDPERTTLVFGVSKKDMEGDPAMGIAPDPRFSFKPKKDGSAPYMQPYSQKVMQTPAPMTRHAYIMSTDVAEFPIAGQTMRDASAIRQAYAGADIKKKMKILTDLYGDAAETMKPIFDNNLQITESVRRLVAAIKPMINEATPAQKAKFVQLLSEAKQRLDPKCWKGKHKEGTKMKGGIRVNNCVPNESMYEDESLTSNNPGGIPESTGKPTHKNRRDMTIVSDLGDNYYLSADEQDDDDKSYVDYAVWTKVPDADEMYTLVNFVNVSSRATREMFDSKIKDIIAADKAENNVTESDTSEEMDIKFKTMTPKCKLVYLNGEQIGEVNKGGDVTHTDWAKMKGNRHQDWAGDINIEGERLPIGRTEKISELKSKIARTIRSYYIRKQHTENNVSECDDYLEEK